jgi:hypothetical protein
MFVKHIFIGRTCKLSTLIWNVYVRQVLVVCWHWTINGYFYLLLNLNAKLRLLNLISFDWIPSWCCSQAWKIIPSLLPSFLPFFICFLSWKSMDDFRWISYCAYYRHLCFNALDSLAVDFDDTWSMVGIYKKLILKASMNAFLYLM